MTRESSWRKPFGLFKKKNVRDSVDPSTSSVTSQAPILQQISPPNDAPKNEGNIPSSATKIIREVTSLSCDGCEYENGGIKWKQTTFQELELNGWKGCAKCAVIARGIKIYDDDCKQLSRVKIMTLPGSPTRVLTERESGGGACLEFYTSPEELPIPGFGIGRKIAPSGGSEEALACVKSWIQDCASEHDLCAQTSTRLPDRVLEPDDLDPVSGGVRLLCQTEELSGPYAALSYCWGKLPVTKLLQSNVDSFEKAISKTELPIVIQEAIWLTQRLGLRYLWVDALCIIQDSPEDWDVQSAQMGAIYANAFLTIAASSSHGSHVSFLSHDHWPHPNERQWGNSRTQITIPYESPETNSNVYVRKEYPYHGQDDRNVAESDPSAPLNSRAWAFQERFLATRLVEFGTDELHWKCRQFSRHECGVSIEPKSSELMLQDSPNTFGKKVLEKAYLHKHWESLVSVYTKRELTYETDKLPALSGIASKLYERFEDKYLAGLWKDDIVNGLLWYSKKPSNRPVSTFSSPTWSWASITGPVQYTSNDSLNRNMDVGFKLLSYDCPPKGQNKFGEVQNAYLVVSGYALQARLSSIYAYDPEDKYPQLSIFNGEIGQGHSLDSIYVGMTPDTKLMPTKVKAGDGTIKKTIRREHDENAVGEVDGEVICLLVDDQKREICVLVLAYSEREKGAFERLGVVKFENNFVIGEECRRLMKGMEMQTLKLI